MDGRLKRLFAFLFAAVLAVDLAGIDCLRSPLSGPCAPTVEVSDAANAGPDCLCCSVAHARPGPGLGAALVFTGVVSHDTRPALADGVERIPYRPPLVHSVL